jgi:membrane protein DedA with SNARE-associated domain
LGFTELLTQHITNFISYTGYPGITFLMMLESMIAPVPSEAVMPFAGFLIFEGKFSWAGVAFASTIGSITGSTISYYLGLYGGKPIVKKFGKYLLLDEHHLNLTEKFFGKYGERAVFLSRFIPIVRHLISIPAGVGKMNPVKFLTYTAIGACAWNVILTYLGYVLRNHWELVHHYNKAIDVVVLLILGTLFCFFVYKGLKSRKIAKGEGRNIPLDPPSKGELGDVETH